MNVESISALSSSEKEAIEWLKLKGGSMLISEIPEKNVKSLAFGNIIPGMAAFKKLEKKGLVFFTEEDEDVSEFDWTLEVHLCNPDDVTT